MSKIKIGDQGISEDNGKYGVVVGRETKQQSDKKILVEYVVKTGNGFENYNAYTRKDIQRAVGVKDDVNVKVYPKVYNYEHKCADGRVLVLTGVVDTYYDDVTEREAYGTNTLFETMRLKKKFLAIGYAICHPTDENDKNIGAEIAYARAMNKPLAFFESPFTGEFRGDFVTDVLISKAKFVEENIERFINRDKK